ncbi:hypothetical protein POZ01_22420 [Phocaeicola vulgatus]|nr:hypothetical protein [Phocaeicola vulgatus]MDC1601724.1 hypothetical protein [Phocaeicola vulgatus]MDC1606748.1 hypothetical protein [Phocaeicola vulgatus]MDC1615936.1 hypothetical protein [Phocaeicola vulgatus]MDC1620276.1 hypothetical protein [Phocaeicola vulgatus]MDC1629232.1 hypothetical protein [Phocaeicola vulgatus]
MANIAAQASKHRMSCRSSSFGRRYLNSRYSSVSELLMVVPERNVAPKSLPVRSCMVRMAKSMFSAFWLPSLFPSPATRSWRVLKVRFLNWWLKSGILDLSHYQNFYEFLIKSLNYLVIIYFVT